MQKAGLINLKDGSTENTQTDAQREKKKAERSGKKIKSTWDTNSKVYL